MSTLLRSRKPLLASLSTARPIQATGRQSQAINRYKPRRSQSSVAASPPSPSPSPAGSDDMAPSGYVIDKSVGPMLRYEKSLPSLPVNPLVETSAKWLESVGPLVDGDREALQNAQQSAEDFVSNPISKKLQARLLERASQKDNWLSEWWNSAAYFGARDPLVFVNYFYSHIDDRTRRTPALRAASLVRALLFFRRMVETQVLEPEMVRHTPLAMSSYEYLFNACRYPEKGMDTAKKFDPSTHNHIVVMRRNKFYEVQVVDRKGEFLSQADLEHQFQDIIKAAGETDDPYSVGSLTTQDRDVWAQARKDLVADRSNAKALERIESAIIIVCLDSEKPVTGDAISWNLWIGNKNGNRFMDKHALIVADNGKSGFNGEHSCMDGTPTSRLNDWMLRALKTEKIELGSPTPSAHLSQPKQITFKLDDRMKQHISEANSALDKIRSQHQMVTLNYEGYGKNAIKKFKTSPDSWAQLVMQLAYFKMTGSLAPTYESAQTRKFKLGRTEVIRSATPEALDWCKAMEDQHTSDIRRLELLRRAANAHIKYAQMAAEGKGVDRHFFGLRHLLQPGEELPSIFRDPIFARSSHWILSTSNLTSEFFNSWGYSEVVPDGFGVAYSVAEDKLRFCICTTTGRAKELAHYIAEAATEVRITMESAISDESGLGRAGKIEGLGKASKL